MGEPHEVYPRVCGGTVGGSMAGIGVRGLSRVCGGTDVLRHGESLVKGLSPRVRGNHQGPYRGGDRAGSIPACAGEPMRWFAAAGMPWVYPRVCGGT